MWWPARPELSASHQVSGCPEPVFALASASWPASATEGDGMAKATRLTTPAASAMAARAGSDVAIMFGEYSLGAG